MKKVFAILLLTIAATIAKAQEDSPLYVDSLQMEWVNSIYDSMTLEEKVGQLFVVAAYSNKDLSHENEIQKLIEEEHIGGLIFMQDDALRQAELTNHYQSKSKVPLIIGMDAEWGLAMRLKGIERFPWAMTLGAVEKEQLIYNLGKSIGEQAKRLGVHFNFAPDVDVNTNPVNPVIGNRSFGSDVENVSRKGICYMDGMKSMGILASAKHFPGHGDTSQDSHKTTPLVNHSKERLNKVELYPFKKLIEAGVASVMVAHLNVPAIEPNGTPSSLSKKVITDLLKNEMQFKGLVITDALNMMGVTQGKAVGDVDYKAFAAGNDILLFSQAVAKGKEKIIQAIQKGEISEERLEESVKKILMAKYYVGLNNLKPVETANLMADLNKPNYAALTLDLFENAVTVLKNSEETLPIKNLNQRFAFVPLEESDYDVFYRYLKKYASVDLVKIKTNAEVHKLKEYDYVIVGVHKSNETPYKSYKISNNSKAIIKSISEQNNTILSIFTSPYALLDLDVSEVKSLLVAYQNTKEAQMSVLQIIFGAVDANGILPVNINDEFKAGESIKLKNISRIGFSFPENQNLNSMILSQIDESAQQAIDMGATPGMQILAARNGRIVYNKAFGYESVERKKKVSTEEIYDIASVTKIVATLPLLMQEVSEGELDLNNTIGDLLPEANSTNKRNIRLKELLAHQSGLPPWIGFYKESVNVQNARLYLDYYSRKQDEEHIYKVTDNIYALTSIKDTIFSDIYNANLSGNKFVYSDLGYYLFQDYLETKHQKPLDSLAQEYFYESMGMRSTTYNPLNKFPKEKIIPTEKDKTYRNQLIHGYVHDQGAAMLGGVAGHAGIFSNAEDLAKIMQMYLNEGYYGGKQYIKKEVVSEFTQRQFSGNHRGAGFDKPKLNYKGKISPNSFGHYGFTGTMVWADPDAQIVYVFLSNRINPSVDNKLLAQKKIRENIHKIIYDAIIEKLEEI